MPKHPTHVEHYAGSLEELAKAIGNMTYDQTASFIEKLANDIHRQADADSKKGRIKLASELYLTADKLYQARTKMYDAWNICEPYMKDKT